MRRRNLLTVGGGKGLEGYLAFEVITPTKFKFSGTSSNTLQYSINGNEWQELANDTYTNVLNQGDKIYFKGTCTPITSSPYGIGRFVSSGGTWNAKGTPMSLLYGDGFSGQTSISGKNYAFGYLFRDCTSLVNAENLSLPAITLASNCYSAMFEYCENLTTAPSLPATTLSSHCYNEMFYGCTSLTTAPSLPATTLANGCYYMMFYDCRSLTSVPSNYLPATTLAPHCYGIMFANCTNLTTAPNLLATTLTEGCYTSMFKGCTSLTTVPSNYLPATTVESFCYQGMFEGCTSLTTAPNLLATTLAQACYRNMFANCTNLTTAPNLLATTLVWGCYWSMFASCTNLSSITCLATDISAYNCTSQWVNGVAASGTFKKASSMLSWTRGSDGIPTNWTVQNA